MEENAEAEKKGRARRLRSGACFSFSVLKGRPTRIRFNAARNESTLQN